MPNSPPLKNSDIITRSRVINNAGISYDSDGYATAEDSDFVLYDADDPDDDGVIVAKAASSKLRVLPSPNAKAMPSILKSLKSQSLPKKSDYPKGSLCRNLTEGKVSIVSQDDPDKLLFYGNGASPQQQAAFRQHREKQRSQQSNLATTYYVKNVTIKSV